MYYCLLRELVYHLNLNYTKFRLAFLEVSSVKYIVINGSKSVPLGTASKISFLYEIAFSIVVIGFLVLGITTALPNDSVVNLIIFLKMAFTKPDK